MEICPIKEAFYREKGVNEMEYTDFVENYISKRIATVELYLKYCNHSVKRRKHIAELKVWKDFNEGRI